MTLLGCDPTAGIADAADAALPQVRRYFDGPGRRLDDGPWNRVIVDLDQETLYHIGARRLDDAEPTFHLFGDDVRDGCAVGPNAGTWLVAKPQQAPSRLLPFVETMDERGRGRLRFTTLDCQVQELVIEDGGRPFSRIYDHGFLIPTKQGYTFADPWLGETREIAATLHRALIWKDTPLLWADDKLKSFSDQLEPGSEWGNGVRSAVPVGEEFLVEDADGMHRVRFDPDSLTLEAESVLPDVCGLQYSESIFTDEKGYWVAAQSPCGSARATLIHIDDESFELLEGITLPVDSDSRFTRALPQVRDTLVVLAAAAFITAPDDDGYGTAYVWQLGTDAPFELGKQVDLDYVSLASDQEPWEGNAYVNYQQLGRMRAHDWIRFDWEGTTELVAERIVRNATSGETLINFDGSSGDLPEFVDDEVHVVLSKIPAYGGIVGSYVGSPHYARVGAFDGTTGEVLLGTDPSDPSSWRSLGSGVPPDQVRFVWFMPALLFLEDWDAEAGTGTLVAYNFELDARDTIATGVSSFDLTTYPWDALIYSVPRGKQRGIWFTKAK